MAPFPRDLFDKTERYNLPRIQVDRRIEMLVNKDLGINDFSIYVCGDRHSRALTIKMWFAKINSCFSKSYEKFLAQF
jgi:hypothetical protein